MQDSETPARQASLQLRMAAAAHREHGRVAESERELRNATAADPQDADAHAELGLTLMMMGRPAEAEPSFRRALEIKPDDIFSLNNLGGALLLLQRAPEAETVLRRVLEIEPAYPHALRNLGGILKDSSRMPEARRHLLAASKVDPSLAAQVSAHLSLAPISRSRADIEEQRSAYAAGVEALAQETIASRYGGEKLILPWFYLAYHAQDNRALIARTAQVVARAAPEEPGGGASAAWRAPAEESRRIRVAFCSECLHDHTIGRLYHGLLKELDKTRFEVLVAHGPYSRADRLRAELDRSVDRAVVLPRAPDAQRRALRELAPDVLFFPDVGMSAQTWFLALARMAPVQAMGWGHPDTSGIPMIDYFLSADEAEGPGAEAYYTERLVRLGRLPAYYPLPAEGPSVARQAFGLPETGTLYGCPQSLFKFHPDFDAVLAQIAEGDPTGRIVLITGPNPAWKSALLERWAASHPVLLERVLFLPSLTHQGFMALLAHIDVLLDPPHFGSGNNLYEAMAPGVPIVTWPGQFMRGRLVAAAYGQMAVTNPPIVERLEDYAAAALALGRDPAGRQRLKAELQQKARRELFDDVAAVRAFEAFLTAAVDAAARGQTLPSGWKSADAGPTT